MIALLSKGRGLVRALVPEKVGAAEEFEGLANQYFVSSAVSTPGEENHPTHLTTSNLAREGKVRRGCRAWSVVAKRKA